MNSLITSSVNIFLSWLMLPTVAESGIYQTKSGDTLYWVTIK